MSPRTPSSAVSFVYATGLPRAMREIIKADALFYVNQKRKIRIYVAVAHYRDVAQLPRDDYLLINLPTRRVFLSQRYVYCKCARIHSRKKKINK